MTPLENREPTVTITFTAAEYECLRNAVNEIHSQNVKEFQEFKSITAGLGLTRTLPHIDTPRLVSAVCQEWLNSQESAEASE